MAFDPMKLHCNIFCSCFFYWYENATPKFFNQTGHTAAINVYFFSFSRLVSLVIASDLELLLSSFYFGKNVNSVLDFVLFDEAAKSVLKTLFVYRTVRVNVIIY